MIDSINFAKNLLTNHKYYISIMICDILFIFFSNNNHSSMNTIASFQLCKYESMGIILFLVILPFEKQFAVHLTINGKPS